MDGSSYIYKVQEYKVEFDFHPFTIGVTVYHENQSELDEDEIIEEALDVINSDFVPHMNVLGSAPVNFTKSDIVSLETLVKK